MKIDNNNDNDNENENENENQNETKQYRYWGYQDSLLLILLFFVKKF